MKKMIVIIDLHCDASMPSGALEFGGGNKYSRNLISVLLTNNIPFLYFTHKKLPELEETIQLSNNSCFYRIPLSGVGINDKDHLQNSISEVISYIMPVLKLYKNCNFIFHSIYWYSGVVADFFSNQYKTYFIHTVLSNGKSKETQGATEDIVFNRSEVEQKVFENAKNIICSSQAEANDIHQYYKIPFEKLIVTGRWLEAEYLLPFHDLSGNPKTYSFSKNMSSHYLTLNTLYSKEKNEYEWWNYKAFIFVGRIHKNKGVSQIIEAWHSLYKKYGEKMPSLWIVGGIPSEIAEFRRNNINNLDELEYAEKNQKIIWWGTLSPEGISTLMSKSLALIAHSKYEAGGNVILEAMAHALPIIATPFGYAKDYIRHNENGYLTAYNDINALLMYLEYFIKQPYLSNYMGRLAQRDIKNIIKNWNFPQIHLQLYEESAENASSILHCSLVPKDSIDVYPYNFTLPSEITIREIVRVNTGSMPLDIKGRGNINTYFLWEVKTLKGTFYFYFLYTILNRKCLKSEQSNYLWTSYQRVSQLITYCKQNDIKLLFSDASEGYILIEQEVKHGLF